MVTDTLIIFSQVTAKSMDVPPPPPPRPQDTAPSQSAAGQWSAVRDVVAPPPPVVKPNQNHAQLASLAKAAAAYAQSKLALEKGGGAAGTAVSIPPPVPGTTTPALPVVPGVPPPYAGNVGSYGVAAQPGVYGTPPQVTTAPTQPATSGTSAYPWMGVTTGSSPYGQHLQQHSIYHMQMMTRMGLWQQTQSTSTTAMGPNQLQNSWGMQTPPNMGGVVAPPGSATPTSMQQQWMAANFPHQQQLANAAQHPGAGGPPMPNQWGAATMQQQQTPGGFPNQQFPGGMMPPYGNFPQYPNDQMHPNFVSPPPHSDPVEDMTGDILEEVVEQLKKIMVKDLCRKMVETSAFKSLENWWDDCERKSKVNVM